MHIKRNFYTTAAPVKLAPPLASAASESLANLIRRRLRQINMTQRELAATAEMGRAYLYRLMHGGVENPGVLTLQRLAHALQLPAAALIRLWTEDASRPARHSLRMEAPDNPDDILMFLGDLTVPDYSAVIPGELFTKRWAIQNLGRTVWPARRLVREDAELVIAQRERHGGLTPLHNAHLTSLESVIEVPATPPGVVVEVCVDFVAPQEECSVASMWRLRTMQGQLCYDKRFFLQVIVTVRGG